VIITFEQTKLSGVYFQDIPS